MNETQIRQPDTPECSDAQSSRPSPDPTHTPL
uniref:Uncharacterized protein n=1 Tax=Anguilla anguilla TaxID=7936 RepID=A0A0E9XZZ5_ANGAN